MQRDGIIDEDFSLRDKSNLIELEEILDDLINKLKTDERTFKIIYQNLPFKVYDKIDNLRNTSLDRKSEDFKRVASKSKEVSKAFHKNFK